MQLKSSIVAYILYLLHDFFRGMIVFAVCRSFLPVAFVRVSHDLLGQYARRERSLQQYVVTYACSATVPANAALISNAYTHLVQCTREMAYRPHAHKLIGKVVYRISQASVGFHRTSVTFESSIICVAHDGIWITFPRSAHQVCLRITLQSRHA